MMIKRRAVEAACLAALGLGAAGGLIAAGSGQRPTTGRGVWIESVRGIEGIDTITLENLEAVLRMQSRPEESRSQGGARTAASLVRMETAETDEERPPDTRQEMSAELEGS